MIAKHSLRGLCVLCLFAVLTACSARVSLFSGMDEGQANQVLSALLDAGIDAQKGADKAGASISVGQDSVAQALNILSNDGLPRVRLDGMGQIFRKEGLVSSPLEERARYIDALSHELDNTLLQIDGVLVARVHVVLPELGGLDSAASPATAAVFIKHRKGFTLDPLIPQIRQLVAHAIPGLTDDRVSVVLVSAQPTPVASTAPPLRTFLGLDVAADSVGPLSIALGTLIVALAVLAGALAYLLKRSDLAAAWLSRLGKQASP